MSETDTQPLDLDSALAALGAKGSEERLRARASLVARGSEATPRLIQLLDEPDPVGHEALRALAALGVPETLEA